MSNNNNKERIGNYEFIKTIGEGTFGKVKLAIHLPTQEYVAIKILEKSRINDKEELERVEKEIKYLKILNHPNIIQIYEVISNEYNYYIVMEYVSGGELFTYIVNHEKLDEKEASFFFTQLIYGIKEIHKNKICHRDIKPENLLLTEKKIIKIIDFGLSNEYIDYLSTQCGSPCYAAPEMIRGMKYSGLMIDLWACGIILFAMLCGYLPFDDKDNNVVFRKILQCKLEFPNENEIFLSNEAKDLIKRILNPNPLKRITIDEVLCHPFLKTGLKEYKNIIKSPLFNQENIIIDYMVKELKYSNENKKINKYIKANRHNSYTTTFKLLKKKIIEGRFDINYLLKENAKNPYVTPIKNLNPKINLKNEDNINVIKVIKNNINIEKINNKDDIPTNDNNLSVKNNQKNIKASLRKSMRENNNNSSINHKINKTCIFHSNKKSVANELIIPKDIKSLEEKPICTIKNNNLIVKDPNKINPIYQKLLSNKKNENNIKKKIDTSVSVEKKKIKKNKKIKIKTNTPFKYIGRNRNPFTYKLDNLKYDNKTFKKKIIYYPKYLLTKRIDISADKINKKNNRNNKNIINPTNIQYIGVLKDKNLKKLEEIRRGYELTPIKIQCITERSADKANKNLNQLKKNQKKNDNKLYKNIYNIKQLNRKEHKPLISDFSINSTISSTITTPINIPNKINYRKIDVKNINNDKKNNNKIYKTIDTARTPIIRRRNNKEELYKKLPYYNTINNNYNTTIQTNKMKNYLIKDNNSQINNTLNTNIIYNNFIYHENNNINNNGIKNERNKNINKINLKKKIKNENSKYIPISQREKKQLIKDDILNIHEKSKIINENYHFLTKNNILILKNPNINVFLSTNINSTTEQIKKNLEGFCKKYKYKCFNYNDSKYRININDSNSFILEINSDNIKKNKIINLYQNKGSNEIIKKNINRLWLEMSNNIYG